MNKVVTLSSGGLDSTVMNSLFREMNYAIHPLFINYGQLNLKREHDACMLNVQRYGFGNLETLNIQDYGRLIPSGITNSNLNIVGDAFLPGRNLLFILCAAAYAKAKNINSIAIGLLNSDFSLFPDQTRKFIKYADDIMSLAMGCKIKILTPLFDFTKQDIIKIAQHNNISETYSCHKGDATPCGVCIACKEFILKEDTDGRR